MDNVTITLAQYDALLRCAAIVRDLKRPMHELLDTLEDRPSCLSVTHAAWHLIQRQGDIIAAIAALGTAGEGP